MNSQRHPIHFAADQITLLKLTWEVLKWREHRSYTDKATTFLLESVKWLKTTPSPVYGWFSLTAPVNVDVLFKELWG